MRKILALMLSVVLCMVSVVPAAFAADTPAVYTLGVATGEPGDTVNVQLNFKTTATMNTSSVKFIIDDDALEFTGFTFDESINSLLNPTFSKAMVAQKTVMAYFNAAGTYDGVVGTAQFKIKDGAAAGDYTISVTPVTKNGSVQIESSVVDGKITIPAPAPVVTGITATTTSAVEIAYADKDDTAAIADAIKAVLKVTAQWSDNSETDVTAGAAIAVDTANTKATITYGDFNDEVTYTVAAAPVEPSTPAVYTLGTASGKAGDTVNVQLNFKTTATMNTSSVKFIIDDDALEFTGFTFDESINSLLNPTFSKAMVAQKTVMAYFNAAGTYDGVVGTAQFKIKDGAAAGDYTISVTPVTKNGSVQIESSVVDGKVTVEGAPVEEPTKYTVTFNVNDAEYKVIEVEEGKAIGDAMPADPSVDHYDFDGWYIGATKVDATYVVTGDVTVTAKLYIHRFDIVYQIPEFDNKYYICYSQKQYGDKFPEAPQWTIEGYTFKGWDKEIPATITEDIVITGIVEINQYTITYVVDGETVKVETYDYNATVTPYDYTPAEGYTFNGWVETIPATMPASDLTITGTTEEVSVDPSTPAVYTLGTVSGKAGDTVNVQLNFKTTATMNTSSVKFIIDDDALEFTGFTFDESINSLLNPTFSKAMVAQKTVMAYFNAAGTYDGVVGTAQFKIKDGAAAGDYTISVTPVTKNGSAQIESSVVDGTITVEGAPAPTPVMSGITVAANAVEIAYADKDDTATIEAAIKAAITSVKAQWTEGKEDTDVAVDDVTITVDTANTKATITYGDFTAEVTYTVAAKPIVYFTVTFKAEGAEDIVIEVEEGQTIGDAMPADPTNGTLGFDGWFDGETAITADTVVNGDIVATAKFSRIVGDVNCDGVKDSKDAIYLLNHCALPDLYTVDDYGYTLDMNGDGAVSSLDAIYLLNSIAIPTLYSLAK